MRTANDAQQTDAKSKLRLRAMESSRSPQLVLELPEVRLWKLGS